MSPRGTHPFSRHSPFLHPFRHPPFFQALTLSSPFQVLTLFSGTHPFFTLSDTHPFFRHSLFLHPLAFRHSPIFLPARSSCQVRQHLSAIMMVETSSPFLLPIRHSPIFQALTNFPHRTFFMSGPPALSAFMMVETSSSFLHPFRHSPIFQALTLFLPARSSCQVRQHLSAFMMVETSGMDSSGPAAKLIAVSSGFCALTGFSQIEVLGNSCLCLAGEAGCGSPKRCSRRGSCLCLAGVAGCGSPKRCSTFWSGRVFPACTGHSWTQMLIICSCLCVRRGITCAGD